MPHSPDRLPSLVLGDSYLSLEAVAAAAVAFMALLHIELACPESLQAVALESLTPAVNTVEGPKGYRRSLQRPLHLAPQKAAS